jgi:hypothetical protein
MITYELSDDRIELLITDGARVAMMRSARPGGFTAEDLDQVKDFKFLVDDGQSNTAWRFFIAGFAIDVVVCTGPPTWWWPRVRLTKGVMVGWFRGMIAIRIHRERRPS